MRTRTTASAPRATSSVFTLGRNRWRARAAWPPPDDGRHAAPPARRRTCCRSRHRSPTSRPTRTLRPGRSGRETVGGNCWALCDGARRPPGAGRPRRHPPVRRRAAGRGARADWAGRGRRCTPSSSARRHRLHGRRSATCSPDGTVNTIQDGIVRARYRDGIDPPSPIEPGASTSTTSRLFATSYVLPPRPPAARRRLVEQLRPLRPQPEHRGTVRHRIRDDRRPAARPPRPRAPVPRRAAAAPAWLMSAPRPGARPSTAAATPSPPATTSPPPPASRSSRRAAMPSTPAARAGIALAVLHPDEVNVAGVAPIMIRTGRGQGRDDRRPRPLAASARPPTCSCASTAARCRWASCAPSCRPRPTPGSPR